MRIHKGILAVSALGLFVGALQACATDVVDVVDEDSGVTPPQDAAKADTSTNRPDTSVPPRDTGTPDTSRPDTSTPTDATTADAADSAVGPRPGELFDPLAPVEGANCPAGVPLNGVVERRCGKCGTQKAFCEAQAGGGANKIGVYSACSGEKTAANACLPRERIVSACGFCGTQAKECDTSCSYIEGACQGQVAGGCVAGEVSYVEGVCNGAGQTPTDVRKQTCSASCALGAPEPCAPRPIPELIVSQTAAATVSTENETIGTIARLSTGACPVTASATVTSYQWVRVKNDGADSVNVTITNVAPMGGTKSDTVFTTYPGPNLPADRLQCTGSVTDFPESVTLNIPAGGSVIVHQNAFSGTGKLKFKLDVKTNFIGAEVPPTIDHTIDIAPVMGGNVTQALTFSATKVSDRLVMAITGNSACPRTLSGTLVPYRYIRVNNPGATARTVDLEMLDNEDEVIAYYAGATVPTGAARLACTGSTNDTCAGGGTNGDADACLNNVSIPAGGSILVWAAHYSETNFDPNSLRVTTKN